MSDHFDRERKTKNIYLLWIAEKTKIILKIPGKAPFNGTFV